MASADPVGRGRSVAGLKEIVQLVEDDLVEVEALFAEHLRSDVPLVGEMGRYILEGGGKRIRPALLLLACRACGYRGAGPIGTSQPARLAIAAGTHNTSQPNVTSNAQETTRRPADAFGSRAIAAQPTDRPRPNSSGTPTMGPMSQA